MSNSGTQAQIAASQAASAASAEAAANALAFSKEIFGKQQQQRQPYLSAGTQSLDMLVNLLGINPYLGSKGGGVIQTGTRGGGIIPTSSSTSSRVPGGGTSTSTTAPPQGSMNKPTVGTSYLGKDVQYPGGSPTFDEGAFRRFEQPIGQNDIADQHVFDSSPSQFGLTSVTDPQGNAKLVPTSLVPFYQVRGFTV